MDVAVKDMDLEVNGKITDSPTTTLPSPPTTIPIVGYQNTFCDNPTGPAPAPFNLGTVHGQQGWSQFQGLSESVLNDAGAKTGSRVWRVKNDVASGAYSSQPLSSPLSVTVGENGVRSAGGGDSFELVFWFKALSTVSDGSWLAVTLWGTDQMYNLNLVNRLDASGGLSVRSSDDLTSPWVVVNSGMARNTWHKVKISFTAVDGIANDIVRIGVNGVLVEQSFKSFETFMRTWSAGVVPPVNRVMFRMPWLPSQVDASFSNGSVQGFMFDDICYRAFNASNPNVTLEYYNTSFE